MKLAIFVFVAAGICSSAAYARSTEPYNDTHGERVADDETSGGSLEIEACRGLCDPNSTSVTRPRTRTANPPDYADAILNNSRPLPSSDATTSI